MLRYLTLLSLSLLLAGPLQAASQAKTYRWVDAKGRVHYSDVPEAPDAQQVRVKPGSGVVDVPKVAVEDNAAECERRRERLTTYESASQITETDALGKSRIYSHDERLKLLDLTRSQVAEVCPPDLPQ